MAKKAHASPPVAIDIQIELWPIERLIPWANNPRTHSREQVARIAASIREFGFTNPILVGADNDIIAGHARLLAAEKLGMKEVQVILLKHLSLAQRRALVIADDQLAIAGAGWDEEMLRIELAILHEEDYDLNLVGFDDIELQRLLEAQDAAPGLVDEDSVPGVQQAPVARPGDVFVLGGAQDYMRRLCRRGCGCEAAGRRPAPPADRRSALWHRARSRMAGSRRIERLRTGRSLLWDKQRAVLTRTLYWFQHEPCWFVRKKNAPWYGKAGENSTVWSCPSPKFIFSGSEKEEKFVHPTQKPMEVMRRPILNHTLPGEAVYDRFLGSGTTPIAAEQTGRVCYGGGTRSEVRRRHLPQIAAVHREAG